MVDYSKWKNIEVSDDEDETHPNIDTPSLFKWRHEARVKRMQEFEEEKNKILNDLKSVQTEKLGIKKKIESKDGNLEELEKTFKKLEAKEKDISTKNEELKKKEKLMPWNVDTISKESWSKTIINKPKPREVKELTEEEKHEHYTKFVEENKKDIKAFGMLSKWDDCKRFLIEKPHLCCEETTNYLTLWCWNLEIEGKSDLVNHVSKQVISMQFILELAKQLNYDPRSCISMFFTKIQKVDTEYHEAFKSEVDAFKKRIKKNAEARLEEIMKELEEEEKQKRLGPGGLDPLEVIETLPADLKECFDTKDLDKLQVVLKNMDVADAQYHMKRCIDSGLWVPNAKDEDSELNTEDNSETDLNPENNSETENLKSSNENEKKVLPQETSS